MCARAIQATRLLVLDGRAKLPDRRCRLALPLNGLRDLDLPPLLSDRRLQQRRDLAIGLQLVQHLRHELLKLLPLRGDLGNVLGHVGVLLEIPAELHRALPQHLGHLGHLLLVLLELGLVHLKGQHQHA